MSNNWVEDFGFTAVDDVTYRKQVIEEEESKVEKPVLAAKEDITSLEDRLEKNLDSIRNMEKKVDSLLRLIYDNEDIVEERKQLADSVANQKVQAISEIVMPLLNSLYRTQNQEWVHWPNRGRIIKQQMEKVEAILDGSYFEKG